MPSNEQDSFRGCLLGLATGDAVGTTVEFQPRGLFPPVTDMVGGGPFSLKPGQWTDDTSMALCLATSLLEVNGFDPKDQMNRYCNWWKNGYMSSNGRCFDMGNTVAEALGRYQQTGEAFSGSTHPRSAGNGSIMRLAPVPMFYFPNREQVVYFSGESSRTTHGTVECVEACQLLSLILYQALSGANKEEILYSNDPASFSADRIKEIARGSYLEKTENEVEGSGYVVRSLEAALWCFWQTDSFEDAILKAVNLGDDADTTGAVCGQIAGAFYGESGIPQKWLKSLAMGEQITQLAERLALASVDS
ncbi:MAG: ADP-ribosylglycohydrolase family protein [Symploca sp. SIO3C6]|nr:ADP-ribosylglycohydrolase family protein [Symploca sp. SIO3C6]